METVKTIHLHFIYLILLPLLKVLFEELRLDQKCKKKLARTTIKNYKSTSEAVVNMSTLNYHYLVFLLVALIKACLSLSRSFAFFLPTGRSGSADQTDLYYKFYAHLLFFCLLILTAASPARVSSIAKACSAVPTRMFR